MSTPPAEGLVELSIQESRRVNTALEAALELDAEASRRWLARELASDPRLGPVALDLLERALAQGSLFDLEPWQESFSRILNADLDTQRCLPGERLGAFEVQQELGRGGMGVVYAGRRADGAYDAKVAIKFALRREDADWLRAVKERRVLAHLDHPGIVRLLDAGRSAGGWPYLVMDYVDGLPFGPQALAKGAEAINLWEQLCSALAHAHARSVVHSDIKPSNVLVDRDLRVQVLDFGVARRVDSPETTQGLGPAFSRPWCAPEQLDGRRVGARADVYSIGLMGAYLLSGVNPTDLCDTSDLPRAGFVSPGLAELARSSAGNSGGGFAQLSRVQRLDFEAIIRACLEPDPAGRYADATALHRDVQAALAGEPLWARRHEGLGLVGLVGLVRRHPTLTSLSTLLFATVLLWTIRSAQHSRALAHERNTAVAAAKRAEATRGFLARTLGAGQHSTSVDGGTSVASLLKQAAQRLEISTDSPQLRGDNALTLAGAFLAAGDSEACLKWSRYAAARAEELGDSRMRREAVHLRVLTKVVTNDLEGAAALARDELRATLSESPLLSVPVRDALVIVGEALDDQDCGQAAWAYGAAVLVGVVSADALTLPASDAYVGFGFCQARSWPAMRVFVGLGLKLRVWHVGLVSLESADAMHKMGMVEPRYEDRVRRLEEAARIEALVVGEGHLYRANTLNDLGLVISREDSQAALAPLRKALAIVAGAYAPGHPRRLTAALNLAVVLREGGHYLESMAVALECARAKDAPAKFVSIAWEQYAMAHEGLPSADAEVVTDAYRAAAEAADRSGRKARAERLRALGRRNQLP